jgi:hypothetical protein
MVGLRQLGFFNLLWLLQPLTMTRYERTKTLHHPIMASTVSKFTFDNGLRPGTHRSCPASDPSDESHPHPTSPTTGRSLQDLLRNFTATAGHIKNNNNKDNSNDAKAPYLSPAEHHYDTESATDTLFYTDDEVSCPSLLPIPDTDSSDDESFNGLSSVPPSVDEFQSESNSAADDSEFDLEADDSSIDTTADLTDAPDEDSIDTAGNTAHDTNFFTNNVAYNDASTNPKLDGNALDAFVKLFLEVNDPDRPLDKPTLPLTPKFFHSPANPSQTPSTSAPPTDALF